MDATAIMPLCKTPVNVLNCDLSVRSDGERVINHDVNPFRAMS